MGLYVIEYEAGPGQTLTLMHEFGDILEAEEFAERPDTVGNADYKLKKVTLAVGETEPPPCDNSGLACKAFRHDETCVARAVAEQQELQDAADAMEEWLSGEEPLT